jgi:UDP-glucose 4-epimerase
LETKRALVTGGAGFMGSWLVDSLVDQGHEVVSADNLLGGKKENINPDCEFVKADLIRRQEVSPLVKGVDLIFHVAAYAAEGQSIFSPISINEINLIPMNNLLVEAVNNNVQRFVFTSSMAVYGQQKPPFNEDLPRKPEDPYGAAKAYCESMLEIFSRIYNFEHVILRPHNVYGPRQNIADPYRNVLGIWINRIMRGKPPIIYGDGRQTRAFSYIDDITSTIVNAGLSRRSEGQIINIGSDQPIAVRKACKLLLELMHSDMKPQYEKARPGEVKHAYCTVKKSIHLLGYETKHGLKDGLAKMVEWARKVGPQQPTYTLPLEIAKGAPRIWLERAM